MALIHGLKDHHIYDALQTVHITLDRPGCAHRDHGGGSLRFKSKRRRFRRAGSDV